MRDGQDFYTNSSPRISYTEIKEVQEALGLLLQREHMFGAHAGPIAVYPLQKDEFVEKANKFLIQNPEVKQT